MPYKPPLCTINTPAKQSVTDENNTDETLEGYIIVPVWDSILADRGAPISSYIKASSIDAVSPANIIAKQAPDGFYKFDRMKTAINVYGQKIITSLTICEVAALIRDALPDKLDHDPYRLPSSLSPDQIRQAVEALKEMR